MMVRAALAYARRLGWATFPLRGKAPAIPGSRGYLDATTHPELIRVYWRNYPTSNVGISCIASGFVAIDVDPRHGGDRTLAELERRHGALPHTVRQITGGCGEHILFRAPPDLYPPGSIGAGIDVKWRLPRRRRIGGHKHVDEPGRQIGERHLQRVVTSRPDVSAASFGVDTRADDDGARVRRSRKIAAGVRALGIAEPLWNGLASGSRPSASRTLR